MYVRRNSVGLEKRGDGYAGKTPQPEHRLYGDSDDGIQQISAYSLGSSGTQRRIFGFGSDYTYRNEYVWRPSQVVLWMPAFVRSDENGKQDRPRPVLLDVSLQRTLSVDFTKHNTLLYEWLSYFRGRVGNRTKAQSTLPFKGGLLSIISSSDGYYKLQHGGAESAMNSVMSKSLQRKIVWFAGALFLAMMALLVLLAAKSSDECSESGRDYSIASVFVSLVATATRRRFPIPRKCIEFQKKMIRSYLGLVLIVLLWVSVSATLRPNIFLLLTDDQDVLLGSMDAMVKTRELLGEAGVTFDNAFVHTPICCPSRSSFLSGRYLQNSGTFQNSIVTGCSNQTWVDGPETRTYAVHAQKAGYRTFYAGKYLNTYAMPGSGPNCTRKDDIGCFRVPLGWDDWHGLQGNSRYYNGTVSNNGVPSTHGSSPEDYLPDVFFGHLKDFLQNHFQDSAASDDTRPFLAVLATPSCHGPFTPAAKYVGHFSNASAPRTPNYNASAQDKQWLMRQQAPLTETIAESIDQIHNARLETLLSVDDYVAEVVSMLERNGELENTFILFTSDHGFQLGQHRLESDKRHLYEHDIRIPLLVRGPGVVANATLNDIVLNVDIAPTITHIASGIVPDDMDGSSILPLILQGRSIDARDLNWRDDFLVSYQGAGNPVCGLQFCPAPAPNEFHENDALNNTYSCVRTISDNEDTIFCEFEDDESFVEFYDHANDPWQLRNLYPNETSDSEIARRKKRLEKFKACRGRECRYL
eukprot:g795.t1